MKKQFLSLTVGVAFVATITDCGSSKTDSTLQVLQRLLLMAY